MRRIITIAGTVLASLLICQSLTGQSTQRKKAQPRELIEDLKRRPDLGADYSRVAKFKLGSRKSTYHIGELISIDLAIINLSDTPVFFHDLSRPLLELNARDEKGVDVLINDYTTALEATSPKAYRQIDPGHLVFASFQLVAGCTNDLYTFLEEMHKLDIEQFGRGEAAYFKGLFERDLFVNWGQACFAVKKPGKYTMTAEQSNDTVLVSPGRLKVKTAVGTLRSSPLTLTIVE